ncbi:MaoC family dehydratase [Acinetobacter portensis]|uniref:Dehydratase n=2 Tax=Acinetobacter TaxID=469 RepID=A0A6L6GC40_9GAMM|nr:MULTISPECIES: MaoC family dehydratase [Acinetobacter]MCK7607827.1 MaoC family dehydratase [Acinetobacter portensis]MCK7638659.1 MaoC family dehydratase [Acinetobacter portensis]MDY6460596.1 MaoC family dehydratase [Acinetobacter faecalis]MDY6483897.1 MaoC family dehydratase [Acinetobacter faecalis]MDY6487608.1 MaoC family dehydratase [Acinetobacter faecalis]
MWYLEDLNIGDKFRSRNYEVTLEEIIEFATKYDPQVFHLDEEKAKDHPIFQGIAASGWHTSSIVMRLWTECFPIADGLIGLEGSMRWPKPTRPGDILHVEVELTDIIPSKSKPDRGIVVYSTQALNQHGDVLLNSSTKILVFRKPQ